MLSSLGDDCARHFAKASARPNGQSPCSRSSLRPKDDSRPPRHSSMLSRWFSRGAAPNGVHLHFVLVYPNRKFPQPRPARSTLRGPGKARQHADQLQGNQQNPIHVPGVLKHLSMSVLPPPPLSFLLGDSLSHETGHVETGADTFAFGPMDLSRPQEA